MNPSQTSNRRTTKRRTLGVALLGAIALLAPVALSSSTSPSAAPAVDSSRPVSLAMAVDPGDPVPMRIVTEKSSGERYKKGHRGQGIDVALIDSGVTPVGGLDQPGKILHGPDLSNEGAYQNVTQPIMGFRCHRDRSSRRRPKDWYPTWERTLP